MKSLQIGNRGANRTLLKNVRDIALATSALIVGNVDQGIFTVSGPDDIIDGFYREIRGEHGIWIKTSTVTDSPVDEPTPPAAA